MKNLLKISVKTFLQNAVVTVLSQLLVLLLRGNLDLWIVLFSSLVTFFAMLYINIRRSKKH
jgi:hypothetical protein